MDFFVMVGTVIDKAIDKARGTQAKAAPVTEAQAGLYPTTGRGKRSPAKQHPTTNVEPPFRLEVAATPRTFGNGAFGRNQAITTTYQWKVMDRFGYIVAYGQAHKQAKAYREGNAALVRYQRG